MKRAYGIDVSYYQGTIDWTAVKASGVEWVILRGGFGNSNVDTQFVNNINGAVAAGIKSIGVYWFSYCHDTDSAQTEVDFCLKTIAPYKQHINLPVFFDWEEASYSYAQRTYGETLTAAQIQQFATTWCNAVAAAGYDTGIYSNKSNAAGWFKTSSGYLWDDLNCEFWYARYGANNETSLFIIPAFEATALSEHPEMKIFQYSDVGRISGINSQRVDLNIRYLEEVEPVTPDEPIETFTPSHGIDYVELRNADREVVGILDTAQSIIWHSVYYGVGDFEVYIKCSEDTISLVNAAEYVTRPNNDEVGIIESISINSNPQDGTMLTISGRFAKSILDRRLIYNLSGKTNAATILRGNVETSVRKVVSANAIDCTDTNRNIDIIGLGAVAGIKKIIVDESGAAAQKQVSYGNLLSYTDSVLQEYGLASKMTLVNGKLLYKVYEGIDRSASNADGNMPIIFAKEYDNLNSSAYSYNTANEKNVALVGGEGEGLNRFYTLMGSASGLSRKEQWVDASSISQKYDDDSGNEQTYTDTEYAEMLKTQGKQSISELKVIEDFDGTLDVTNGNWVYGIDFSLGDIVTVQDNDIGKYINARITEVTEVQDENGFSVDAVYQGE